MSVVMVVQVFQLHVLIPVQYWISYCVMTSWVSVDTFRYVEVILQKAVLTDVRWQGLADG